LALKTAAHSTCVSVVRYTRLSFGVLGFRVMGYWVGVLGLGLHTPTGPGGGHLKTQTTSLEFLA